MARFRVQFSADFEADDHQHALRVVAGFFAAELAGFPPSEEFQHALRLTLAPEVPDTEEIPTGLVGLARREAAV